MHHSILNWTKQCKKNGNHSVSIYNVERLSQKSCTSAKKTFDGIKNKNQAIIVSSFPVGNDNQFVSFQFQMGYFCIYVYVYVSLWFMRKRCFCKQQQKNYSK